MSQERAVNLKRSFIVPGIFMIWGLSKMIANFAYLGTSLLAYIVALAFGCGLGYLLYNRTQRFYFKQGVAYHAKNYLPLLVILINFVVKYTLTVTLIMNPGLGYQLSFIVTYSLISGLTVGMFFGGIYNTYINAKQRHGSLAK